MKLQAKVLILIVPLIMAPLVLFGWISYSQLRLIHTKDLQQELEVAVTQSSRLVTGEIQTATANVELFSHSVAIENYLVNGKPGRQQEKIGDDFATYRLAYPQYRRVALLDAAGKPLVQRTRSNGPGQRDEDYGRYRALVKSLREFYGHIWIGMVPDPDVQDVTLELVAPLRTGHGTAHRSEGEPKLLGYFALTLDLKIVERLIRDTEVGDDGGIFMIDSRGQVLAHRHADWLGRQLPAETTAAIQTGSTNRQSADTLFGGQFGEPREESDRRTIQSMLLGGQEMLLRAEETHPGMIMVGYLPVRELAASGRQLAIAAGSLITGVVILVVLLIVLVLRRVVIRPIHALHRAVQQVGQGNLLIPPTARSSDEFGALYRSFEEMGRNLHEAQEELQTQTHAAERASAAKSRFLAHMSHEIRTPLNGVLGSADLLSREALTDAQRHQVEVIRSSGKLLTSVIGDILDFTKIEAGRLEFRDEAFRLADLLADVSGIFEAVALDRGIGFTVAADDDLPPILRGDRYRLSQILTNLVGNALKFTEQGQVTLRLARAKVAGPERQICFTVADSGIGIAPEERDHVFDAFSQVTDASHSHVGGTGLGLAICKQLVEAMGGTIGLDSQPGTGSNFWFLLPLRPASAAEIADEAERRRPGAVALRPARANASGDADGKRQPRILLAEDNQVNRDITRAMLRNLGCEVFAVGTGRLALEALGRETFDLVLMDCDMPDLDGIAATREIRRQEAQDDGNAHIPIVAQTANAFEESRRDCAAAGMDGYLCKPFDQDELAASLTQWLPWLPKPAPAEPAVEAPDPDDAAQIAQLDRTALARVQALQGTDAPDLLSQVIQSYLEQSKSLLSALEAAVAAGDAAALQSAAHSLKSSSANLGALDLAQRLGTIERLAREGQTTAAATQSTAIAAALAAVHEALAAECHGEARGAA